MFCILGNIQDLGMSPNGEFCCTISDDKSAKVFDVVNFGKFLIYKLVCLWVRRRKPKQNNNVVTTISAGNSEILQSNNLTFIIDIYI